MAFTRLLGACLILTMIGGPAYAHEYPCNTRERAVEIVQGRYGETWIAHATTINGKFRYELWRSKGGASFTLMITWQQGERRLACFVAAGKNWKWADRKAGE